MNCNGRMDLNVWSYQWSSSKLRYTSRRCNIFQRQKQLIPNHESAQLSSRKSAIFSAISRLLQLYLVLIIQSLHSVNWDIEGHTAYRLDRQEKECRYIHNTVSEKTSNELSASFLKYNYTPRSRSRFCPRCRTTICIFWWMRRARRLLWLILQNQTLSSSKFSIMI